MADAATADAATLRLRGGLGAQHRRFRTVTPGSASQPAVYALRADLASVLWQPDSAVERCPACRREFGFFRRMHHCRACGFVYCDDDCHENDAHDNERVCVTCLAALGELNRQKQQEFNDRIERGRRATLELASIASVHVQGRAEIVDEETEARSTLMDSMREARRQLAASVRDRINNVVGSVAQVERRRARPAFGTRAGELRLRVLRVRNLQPVKPAMTCYPHVVVEVGSERRRSQTVALPNASDRGTALDFLFPEWFVFDVEDDRVGAVIAVLDSESIPGVDVLLGVAYVNLRRSDVIEEELPPPGAAAPDGTHANEPLAQPLIAKGREKLLDESKPKDAIAAAPAQATAAGAAAGETAAPRERLKYLERCTAPRALCDYDGRALMASTLVVQWTFHQYRTNATRKPSMCASCQQVDAPGACLCQDADRERRQEEFVKARLRQTAGELHATEVAMRRRKIEAGGGAAGNEPAINITDGEVPVLRPAMKYVEVVSDCCC
jgi:hypothetical protein